MAAHIAGEAPGMTQLSFPCGMGLPQGRAAGCTQRAEGTGGLHTNFPCDLCLPQGRAPGCTHSEREGQPGLHT